MRCRRPFMVGSLECPCGGCLPCRINRRRIWAHRILLESYSHGDSCFVTLTYDEVHCPDELVKSDYQKFFKRLRRVLAPKKVRYFLAGEYGELSGRPHFHAAIFGLDRVAAGGDSGGDGVVRQCWPFGFTYVGELSWDSAQYIAGYLTKKVVGEKSHREFSRMSLRPAIGRDAMQVVADALYAPSQFDPLSVLGDVPSSLRHGGKLLPLGRYLRRELRGKLGFASKDTPAEAARLFVLRKALEASEKRSELAGAGFKSWDIHKIMLDSRSQTIKNTEARFKLRDSKRKLI